MYDKILDLIRKIAPEFNEIADEKLEGFIDVYANLVSKRYFGKHYNKAIAFLVAHQLTLLNIASNMAQPLGGLSQIVDGCVG